MTDLAERPIWEEGVHVIDTEEEVLGGPDGPDNFPHRQLTNRTAYLKEEVEKRSEIGHGHTIPQVEGLQEALDGRSASVHKHAIADVNGLQGQLDSFQTDLRGKAGNSHHHAIAEVDGLQGQLDSVQTDLRGKAATGHVHDASQVTTGVFDPARIPVLPSQKQIPSSGLLGGLTADQQAQIGQGTVVTTTDGLRYVYTGSGPKTDAASYIALADITPEWNAVQNKPATFPPTAHQHEIANVNGLADALAALGAILPAGLCFPYAGGNTPTGFLWCDGSAVGRADFARLFAAIGTTYGLGDGSTTFNLPDFRGQFLRGAGNGVALGAKGGAASLTLTQAQVPIPAHAHTMFTNETKDAASSPGAVANQPVAMTAGAGGGGINEAYGMKEGAGTPTIGITGQNTAQAATDSISLIPPFIAANFIIKT